MEFSQTRLKLRVAVCPYVAHSGPEYYHRVIGIKRESGSNVSLVILRQFLLLLPLDCSFADLTSRVISQYEKLYQNQPAYIPIKNIALFRDSNQCDLDLDFLVSDICASNDLIYAMVEIEESNKKIKIVAENTKQQIEKVKNIPNQEKAQQEKKAPEFKPIPVKIPSVKQPQVKNETKTDTKPIEIVKPVNPVEAKKVQDVKVTEIKKVETKAQEEIKGKVITTKVLGTKVEDNKVSVPIKASETKSQDIKATETKTPTPITKPSEPTPKKNQKQVEEVKTEVVTENFSDSVVLKVAEKPVVIESVSEPVVATELEVPSTTIEPEQKSVVTIASCSEAVSSQEKRFNDMITPVPTPIPRPIFHPRKSEIPPNSSSSDEDESQSILDTFDATNLFGPQVITSEPRRSDAFVLFAAGSSDDSSSDENEVNIPVVPLKSSSIVSLQAAPSSELFEEESESESEEETTTEIQLPQSVTLRRLSSISPIPDPSEIPSLFELKESINRAPTPIQIIQGQQQSQNKGGRPIKKQAAGKNQGRPKKLIQSQQKS